MKWPRDGNLELLRMSGNYMTVVRILVEIRTGGVVQVRNSDKIGNMALEPVLVRPWGGHRSLRICRSSCIKATDNRK